MVVVGNRHLLLGCVKATFQDCTHPFEAAKEGMEAAFRNPALPGWFATRPAKTRDSGIRFAQGSECSIVHLRSCRSYGKGRSVAIAGRRGSVRHPWPESQSRWQTIQDREQTPRAIPGRRPT